MWMFTEEILNGKLHFLCSAPIEKANAEADMDSDTSDDISDFFFLFTLF